VRFALGSLLILAVFTAIVALLNGVQLPRIYAVVPAFSTALLITDLLTAALLFAQFSILRTRALIAISSGYLYTGMIVVPWALTFPGVFSPGGLLGAGLYTTQWLYILWHAGFPMFVMSYAVLKDRDPAKDSWRGSLAVAMVSSIVFVAALVCAVTILTTVGQDLLPRVAVDQMHFPRNWTMALGCTSLVAGSAAVLMWFRRRSVLDLWLTVVATSYFLELFLASILSVGHNGISRFDVAWYANRIFGLLSATLILLALLYETTTLYGRLLRAHLAQHRERVARLMTGDAVSASIAHEVRQPLSAIATNADAGLRWIAQETPDLGEVEAALQRILCDGNRAEAVIENARAAFRRSTKFRTSFDISKLISESLALLSADLKAHQVSVITDLNERLSHITGDQIQLQQVLLNLITNAIESMATMKDGERVLRIRSDWNGSEAVIISVEDSGSGIKRQNMDRIFDPLFSTKPDGMGMGLAICRSITEVHGGSLWALPNKSRGAIFQLSLPAEARALASN